MKPSKENRISRLRPSYQRCGPVPGTELPATVIKRCCSRMQSRTAKQKKQLSRLHLEYRGPEGRCRLSGRSWQNRPDHLCGRGKRICLSGLSEKCPAALSRAHRGDRPGSRNILKAVSGDSIDEGTL